MVRKILILVVLCSCTGQSSDSLNLTGKWEMVSVVEYGKDVTDKHNPARDRYIELKDDGTFVSDGAPFGRNTGRWTFDKTKHIMFIDSDVDNDDSEWLLDFSGEDEMIWTGVGHPRKQNTKLIHKRSK